MNQQWWSADWQVLQSVNTSRPICVTCHNVHGSTQLAMVRDGKLIGREPGLKVWYYNEDTTLVNETNSNPPDPEDTPLASSDGSVRRAWTARYVCNHCHNNNNTIKEPWAPFQDTAVAPTLDWTDETGFVSDGANPDFGASGSTFTFRAKYTDLNNDGPVTPDGYVKLYIDTDNDGNADNVYDIEGVEEGDNNYIDGKIYSKTLVLTDISGSVIGYKFAARDTTALDATGPPTNWSTVSFTGGQLNTAPELAWVDGTCRFQGVSPATGENNTNFDFYVRYTDADNQFSSLQIWVDLNDDEDYDDINEKQNMTVDGGDGDYSNGENFIKTMTLSYAGDGMLNYRFVASDGIDDATGQPVGVQSVTVYDSGLTPITVCASGCDETNVQAGIDAAKNVDYLTLVYEGTYTERLNLWTGTYSNSKVRSVCGPDETIIKYDGNEVIFLQNVTGVEIDGFGITSVTTDGSLTGVRSNGGDATINNCKIYGHHNTGRGGALVFGGGDGPTMTVTNSEIYDNESDSDGGAINLNQASDPDHSVTNTIIRNNTAGGGGGAVFTQNGSVIFTDVTIEDNTAATSGGVVYSNGSTVDFIRSTITGNKANGGNGGVIAQGNSSSDVFFENCIVANNEAVSGGVSYVNAADFTAINSTFAFNEATGGDGGVLWHQNGPATIFRNSILWGNSASGGGHNVYFNGGSMTVADSIIASGGDGVYDNAPYFTTSGAAYTLTFDGYVSEDDPMFIDAESGDYHIQVISPAVDNGSAAYAPDIDIDVDIRPQGLADDI